MICHNCSHCEYVHEYGILFCTLKQEPIYPRFGDYENCRFFKEYIEED